MKQIPMKVQTIAFVGLLLGIITLTSAQRCPRPCFCMSTSSTVRCEYKRLTDIPLGFPNDTKRMFFRGNSITTLRANRFDYLTELEYLDLDDCKIIVIEVGAFDGLTSLKTLKLDNNLMVSLPPSVFRNLNLKRLSLRVNDELIELSSNAFNIFTSELLDLSYSDKLANIKSDSFTGANIKSIIIIDSDITAVGSKAFSPLGSSLASLSISRNRRPLVLPDDPFDGLNLHSLALWQDGLTRLNFLWGLRTKTLALNSNNFDSVDLSPYVLLKETLTRISLNDCGIDYLTRRSFDNLERVTNLELSRNNLTILDGAFFEDLKNLSQIFLSYNQIHTITDDFGDYLPNLAYLGLRYNSISRVNGAMFAKMRRLIQLNLSFNKIQFIPKDMKPILDKLVRNKDFEGNPFHCNCEMLWFWEWAKVNSSKFRTMRCATPLHPPKSFYLMREEDFICIPATLCGSPNITLSLGGSGNVSCSTSGDPAPKLTISNNEGRIVGQSDFPANKTTLENEVIFEIDTVTPGFVGSYICNATHPLGDLTMDTCLRVMTPVGTPEPPFRSNDICISSTTNSTTTTTTIAPTIEAKTTRSEELPTEADSTYSTGLTTSECPESNWTENEKTTTSSTPGNNLPLQDGITMTRFTTSMIAGILCTFVGTLLLVAVLLYLYRRKGSKRQHKDITASDVTGAGYANDGYYESKNL
ncbi:unnamed protein product [Owenia fusiformis]|uniref:Uncharacterized protein n=1 Tax=Owenia fusiformis TaxID=6347 RepID=A0A8J1XTG5_OWEFU|nr:unnamed protein product [Owenia fusiformis]